MDLYAIYLRKSRMDMEAEAHGEGETLKRHEAALLALAQSRRYCVGEVYREVVSGDTIAGRPEMRRLLSDVENNRWKGVLVMEESRLARGDTMDQGRVQQAFYYSHTLIITPNKTFDPDSEADQEYFEFGLFMSRREYKMINRRLQRGREASVREGKWVGSFAPYGYRKVKLQGEKGSILEPIPEQAQVVRSIFDWWVKEGIGTLTIAHRLNDAGIPTQKGQLWTTQAVRNVLDNPAYCGLIRYSYRQCEKKPVNGEIEKHYYRAKYEPGITIFPGRHQAIISQELFDEALKKRRWVPGVKMRGEFIMQNPFSGLLYCGECGRVLCRNKGKPGSMDRVMCTYPACKASGSTTIPLVEETLMHTLRLKLAELELPEKPQQNNDNMAELLTGSIEDTKHSLEKLSKQKDAAYDLVEQGAYTPAVFAARMETLSLREDELTAQLTALTAQLEQLTSSAKLEQELAPKIRNVLDLYPTLSDAESKNCLLKTCISNIIYHRPRYSTADELSLEVFYLI